MESKDTSDLSVPIYIILSIIITVGVVVVVLKVVVYYYCCFYYCYHYIYGIYRECFTMLQLFGALLLGLPKSIH